MVGSYGKVNVDGMWPEGGPQFYIAIAGRNIFYELRMQFLKPSMYDSRKCDVAWWRWGYPISQITGRKF